MDISATHVKELRELSGAGVMDCKRALVDAGGDMQRALQLLRETGLAQVAKRADREASQGIIEAYIHGEGRIGVLVELNCETDFVARTADFHQLAHDIALQVAATNPQAVDESEDATADPDALPLLKQPFIKDPGRTVAEIVQDVAAKTRENIVVRRISRFELGA
ncbi:MAG: translation elongation factor Ts [Chloroflexi bacterium]|nr:translation elongation factor Ts [Chloroflexota bacterium]